MLPHLACPVVIGSESAQFGFKTSVADVKQLPLPAATSSTPLTDTVAKVSVLTSRERTVVYEVTKGLPLKVIASNLSLSIQTVSTYLERARRKLGAPSRTGLLTMMFGNSFREAHIANLTTRSQLTAAELAVGRAVIIGASYASIASSRLTSVGTVQKQASSLFAKCGVSSRFHFTALILTGHY